MVDATPSRRFTYWLLFLGLASLIGFIMLLPLQPGPSGIPGPDLLVLVAIAWTIRRPDYIPIGLAAVVFLMADLLFMRPPGIWTAIVVLALEVLRSRSGSMRDSTFFTEWLTVAAIVTAMFFANSVLLTIFVVEQPGLGQTLIRLIFTVLVYPVVVALAAKMFGLRKITPGEVDQLGRKR